MTRSVLSSPSSFTTHRSALSPFKARRRAAVSPDALGVVQRPPTLRKQGVDDVQAFKIGGEGEAGDGNPGSRLANMIVVITVLYCSLLYQLSSTVRYRQVLAHRRKVRVGHGRRRITSGKRWSAEFHRKWLVCTEDQRRRLASLFSTHHCPDSSLEIPRCQGCYSIVSVPRSSRCSQVAEAQTATDANDRR